MGRHKRIDVSIDPLRGSVVPPPSANVPAPGAVPPVIASPSRVVNPSVLANVPPANRPVLNVVIPSVPANVPPPVAVVPPANLSPPSVPANVPPPVAVVPPAPVVIPSVPANVPPPAPGAPPPGYRPIAPPPILMPPAAVPPAPAFVAPAPVVIPSVPANVPPALGAPPPPPLLMPPAVHLSARPSPAGQHAVHSSRPSVAPPPWTTRFATFFTSLPGLVIPIAGLGVGWTLLEGLVQWIWMALCLGVLGLWIGSYRF